jgi:hypothetical protein
VNECLINLEFEEDSFTFCFEYLTWKEAMDIEAKSHQLSENEYVLNSEKEKRLILDKKFVWMENNISNEKFDNKDILKNIKHKALEIVWQKYYQENYLTANEASFYYEAAKNYFSESPTNFPTPSIVIEVGMMLKNIITMNRQEFNSLSMKEFEIIQLVMSLKQ